MQNTRTGVLVWGFWGVGEGTGRRNRGRSGRLVEAPTGSESNDDRPPSVPSSGGLRLYGTAPPGRDETDRCGDCGEPRKRCAKEPGEAGEGGCSKVTLPSGCTTFTGGGSAAGGGGGGSGRRLGEDPMRNAPGLATLRSDAGLAVGWPPPRRGEVVLDSRCCQFASTVTSACGSSSSSSSRNAWGREEAAEARRKGSALPTCGTWLAEASR